MLVSALIRQAEMQGAFATVLRRGDRIAGAVLLIRREKGRNPALFERLPSFDGLGKWSEITMEPIEKEELITNFVDRRVAQDPDIWVLELDVPSEERFTDILALMN